MHEINVKIKLTSQIVNVPQYATEHSAGVDLCSTKYCIINPSELELIPTGIHLAIPEGYEGQIRPRSGLALNHRIVIPNTPGTIDADYRGEIKVMLLNLGDKPFCVYFGDRIAQMVFVPVAHAAFEEVEVLDTTKRGENGFGSTGI